MERNRLHAALIALCVLAVIFGASLFPATGFGSYPAGPGGGSRPVDSGGRYADSRSATATNPRSDGGTVAVTTRSTTDSDSNGESVGSDSTTTTTTTTTAVGGSSSANGGLRLVRKLLFGAGAVLLLVLAVIGIGFRTGTVTFDGRGRVPLEVFGMPVGELFGKVPSLTMSLVVGFSASIPRFADDAIGLLGEVVRGLATGTVGLGTGIVKTFGIVGRGIGGTLLAIGSVGSGLFSIPKTLSRPTLGRSGKESKNRTTTTNHPATPEPEETAPPSVEEAWESMTERLPVSRRRTKTPEEYAREAVKRGYPRDAVRQLTDAFREVRYGSFPPSAKRTKLARAALDKIDRFGEGDG